MAVDMEKEKEEEMDKEQDSRPSMDGQDASSSFVTALEVSFLLVSSKPKGLGEKGAPRLRGATKMPLLF